MRDWINAGSGKPTPRRIYRGRVMPNVQKPTAEDYKMLNDKLDIIILQQKNSEIKDAQREHYFTDLEKMKETIEGNGKPGFVAIRDKVLSWDSKLTSLSLLVLGDIVFRVFTLIYSK